MILTDLYQLLFGKNHIQDGNVIDMAEHGRVGGVSTGQSFKYTASVNPDTGATVDDSLMLLRDIRKLLKASAYKDAGDRQIVKIGAVGGISGGAELTTSMPVSGTVTATVASTTITQAGTHDSRLLNYDMARVKYSTGMRANLSIT